MAGEAAHMTATLEQGPRTVAVTPVQVQEVYQPTTIQRIYYYAGSVVDFARMTIQQIHEGVMTIKAKLS